MKYNRQLELVIACLEAYKKMIEERQAQIDEKLTQLKAEGMYYSETYRQLDDEFYSLLLAKMRATHAITETETTHKILTAFYCPDALKEECCLTGLIDC
jgi:hypothetical protein